MSDTARKPLKPWQRRRRVWLAVAVCVVLACVAVALYVGSVQSEVEREIDALRGEGLPVNRQEYARWRESEAASKTSTPAATDRLPKPAAPPDLSHLPQGLHAEPSFEYLDRISPSRDALNAAQTASDPALDAVRELLENYAGVRAILFELAERIGAGATPETGVVGDGWHIGDLAGIWAELLLFEAGLAALEGDGARAGAALLAHIRMGHLEFGPQFPGDLLPFGRERFLDGNLHSLSRQVLPRTALPEDILGALRNEYAAVFDPGLPRRMVVAARASGLEDFDSARRRYESSLNYQINHNAAGADWEGIGADALDAIGWYQQDRLRFLQAMRELEQITTLAPQDAIYQLDRIQEQYDPVISGLPISPYSEGAVFVCHQIRGWYYYGALLSCGAAITAIERYRNEHGVAPATLADLPPATLAALPRDPYADAPIGYLPTPEGYVVFSIGPNFRPETTVFAVDTIAMIVEDIRYGVRFR